jgi:hypothetical protein
MILDRGKTQLKRICVYMDRLVTANAPCCCIVDERSRTQLLSCLENSEKNGDEKSATWKRVRLGIDPKFSGE